MIWRPVAAWLLLMLLLIGCAVAQIVALGGYYQTRQPVAGGIYTEGILGSFTNANPLYATNQVDRAVSRLLFPGLLTYNEKNELVGDLAKTWNVDTAGTTYTVTLRDNLTWHDGKPLTADDVVFTYQVIQNADAESPLRSSWQGITVAKVDSRTVTFTLPNPLASFSSGLTNGIIPKHLLGTVPMVGMRSSSFNSHSPVGSGPFMWRSISVKGTDAQHADQTIGLSANPDFYAGPPKLKSFVVRAFADQTMMVQAYQKKQLTAMSGLNRVPDGLQSDQYVKTELPLSAATMTFFNMNAGVLTDRTVRTALVDAADPTAIIQQLGYSTRPVREPLLLGQFGYDKRYVQKTADTATASRILDKAGWKAGTDGIRSKKKQLLSFTLTYANTAEYRTVARTLQRQWQDIGVRMNEQPLDEASFRSALLSHDYEAVLYGITIGTDPDVYVYWASTQADVRAANRLNLSEYKSTIVDDALGAGRTRTDEALRKAKYQTFLAQWQKDAPALGLYQPRYLYLSRVHVYGLSQGELNTPIDRLNNADDWMIRTARVTTE
jgi:peptide/nickel transport system substrate-binding protein